MKELIFILILLGISIMPVMLWVYGAFITSSKFLSSIQFKDRLLDKDKMFVNIVIGIGGIIVPTMVAMVFKLIYELLTDLYNYIPY